MLITNQLNVLKLMWIQLVSNPMMQSIYFGYRFEWMLWIAGLEK